MKPKLSKHTMLLFEGDYEKLQEKYPETGASIVIRNLIRNHLAPSEIPLDLTKIKVGDVSDV